MLSDLTDDSVTKYASDKMSGYPHYTHHSPVSVLPPQS